MSPLKIQRTNQSLSWICKYIYIQDNSLLSEVTCFAPGTCSIASRYHVTSQIISLCTVHARNFTCLPISENTGIIPLKGILQNI